MYYQYPLLPPALTFSYKYAIVMPILGHSEIVLCKGSKQLITQKPCGVSTLKTDKYHEKNNTNLIDVYLCYLLWPEKGKREDLH